MWWIFTSFSAKFSLLSLAQITWKPVHDLRVSSTKSCNEVFNRASSVRVRYKYLFCRQLTNQWASPRTALKHGVSVFCFYSFGGTAQYTPGQPLGFSWDSWVRATTSYYLPFLSMAQIMMSCFTEEEDLIVWAARAWSPTGDDHNSSYNHILSFAWPIKLCFSWLDSIQLCL